MSHEHPLITNDAVVLGLLALLLMGIFRSAASDRPFWKKFYGVVPPLLLCYFLPGLLNSAGIVSGEQSGLYAMASTYLLPASLVLFTLNLDLREIWRLRRRAGLLMAVSMLSIVIGGPIALSLVSWFAPGLTAGEGADQAWRGLSTVAGSWIGGGANQAALYEMFKPSSSLYSASIAMDVMVANIWMACLLYGAGQHRRLDRRLKAGDREFLELRGKMEARARESSRPPGMADLMSILGVGLGVTGFSHLAAGFIAPWIAERAPGLEHLSLTSSFFWMVVLATAMGIGLSFTPLRKLEQAGASRVGSVFLYLLVTTIGMKMNIFSVFTMPSLFAVGLVWIFLHASLLLLTARITRTSFFYMAVSSQACIGGAASAPVVAGAFHPSLAPVGVLLAILGYAAGTYGGYICALLMQWVST